MFNHEVSPGLPIEGSDRDSCFDPGWNTCGILKLGLLVEYSKGISPLGTMLFRDSAILVVYSCLGVQGVMFPKSSCSTQDGLSAKHGQHQKYKGHFLIFTHFSGST